MLRENEDVFKVFSQKAHKMNYLVNEGFVDTLTNFIYTDLCKSQSDNKLAVVIRQLIKEEVNACGNDWKRLAGGLSGKIFKIFTERGEVRKYIDYLFKAKYQRIDFYYLDIKDTYSIFIK